MRTGSTKLSFGRKLSLWLITAAAAAGVVVSALYSAMRGQAAEVCSYKAKQTVNEMISSEIARCLESDDGSYVDICCRADGSPGVLRADVIKMNALENELRGRINERLSALEDVDISVPVGTLTGVSFLSEKGFDVTMKLQLDGAADVDIKGSLESAGVNQTRHVLRLEVTCGVLAQLPGYNERITAEGEYIISDTMIVGEVPQSYYAR